jgi:hypothetical protein
MYKYFIGLYIILLFLLIGCGNSTYNEFSNMSLDEKTEFWTSKLIDNRTWWDNIFIDSLGLQQTHDVAVIQLRSINLEREMALCEAGHCISTPAEFKIKYENLIADQVKLIDKLRVTIEGLDE